MAIRSTAASNHLVSTAGLPSPSGSWTVMFRAKLTNDTNARVRMVTLAGTGGQTISMGTSAADGTTFCVRTGAVQVDGTNLTVGDWNWFTLVRATDVSSGYLNGVLDASHTVAASWTPAGIYLFSATIDGLDGCIEGFKFWDAALTATEIQAEMVSLSPIRTANLNRWTPLVPYGSGTRNLDRSGNGYNWTEVGTLTDEAGSGTPWHAVAAVAAGVATSSTLTGAATKAATLTAAAGTASAASLTGRSTAATTLTAGAGQGTAVALSGSAVVSADMAPAAGAATAATMTSDVLVTTAADMVPAAGGAGAQTLPGGSVSAAAMSAASGAGAAQALAGASTAASGLTVATGSGTGLPLVGGTAGGSSMTPAAGAGAAQALAGSSVAAAVMTPAAGAGQGLALATNGAPPAQTGGGYDYPSRKRKARIIRDDRDDREREFQALLDLVTGLAEAEAVEDVREAEPMQAPRLPAPVVQLAVPDVRPRLARAFAEGYRRTYRAEVRRVNLEQDDEDALAALL